MRIFIIGIAVALFLAYEGMWGFIFLEAILAFGVAIIMWLLQSLDDDVERIRSGRHQ